MEPVKSGMKPGSTGAAFFPLPGNEITFKTRRMR